MDTISQIQKWKIFVNNQERRSHNRKLRHEKTNSMKAFDYFDINKIDQSRQRNNNIDLGPHERAF